MECGIIVENVWNVKKRKKDVDRFVQIINREKECGKSGKKSGIFGNVHIVSKSYSQDIPILWITLC